MEDIHSKIKVQGNKVRDLKSNKADKDTVKQEVDVLLELKKQFKAATNVDWKPDIDISQFVTSSASLKTSSSAKSDVAGGSAALEIDNKIKKQGDEVRGLKASKADKDVIKQAVDILLDLKKQFKEATNVDWKPDIDISQFACASTPTPASAPGGAASYLLCMFSIYIIM